MQTLELSGPGNIHKCSEEAGRDEGAQGAAAPLPPLRSSVFVDVEELCYFVEIVVLLPVFDDLKEGGRH